MGRKRNSTTDIIGSAFGENAELLRGKLSEQDLTAAAKLVMHLFAEASASRMVCVPLPVFNHRSIVEVLAVDGLDPIVTMADRLGHYIPR